MKFIDWNNIDYTKALAKQRELFQLGIEQRKTGTNLGFENQIIFCEHNHIFTLGRNANMSNLLVSENELQKLGIECLKIERGGNITYHGPGQLVVYPIINLKDYNIYIKDFVWRLEEIIIRTLKEYNITGQRIESAPGVWLDANKPEKRKIAALGVRASRFISMHGFSFNINPNMDYFNMINPCGFDSKSVTSLAKETNYSIELNEIKEKIRLEFLNLFVKQI